MREDGKLDYLELPATDLAQTKDFYTKAFGWTFVDYGPAYAAFGGAAFWAMAALCAAAVPASLALKPRP